MRLKWSTELFNERTSHCFFLYVTVMRNIFMKGVTLIRIVMFKLKVGSKDIKFNLKPKLLSSESKYLHHFLSLLVPIFSLLTQGMVTMVS